MTIEELELEARRATVKLLVEKYNTPVGNLDGCNCERCKNRGYYYLNRDTWAEKVICQCMENRAVLSLAQHSGLGALLDNCTLNKFNDFGEDWRKHIFLRANEFLASDKAFFFIGGQVGCGKSFICTALVNEFIHKQKLDCKFVLWTEIVTSLKQSAYDDAERYNEILSELKNATVLYIDDFFNTQPTNADIDKAFQIINYRYNQARIKSKKCITLISSERHLDEIKRIHEGIATRIGELATARFTLNVKRASGRNIRERQLIDTTNI